MIPGTYESITKQTELLRFRRKRGRDDRAEYRLPAQFGKSAKRWAHYGTSAKLWHLIRSELNQFIELSKPNSISKFSYRQSNQSWIGSRA